MSYGQIHRRDPELVKREISAFVNALREVKRQSMRDRAHRIGPWLFAWHRTIGMTWKPRLDLWPDQGWSLWWLWFEVARVVVAPTPSEAGEKP